MKKLRIGVVDLVPQGPASSLWARVMNANMASIMPQVISVWCEQLGHHVTYFCYTGFEDLEAAIPNNCDVVFVSSFTRSAQFAYAVSALLRARGAITILGGPHARCFPDDACKYFDYVVGLTDRELVADVLRDCAPSRPVGHHLSAARQPTGLPSVEERWKFISANLDKAPLVKLVPLIASFGCPYTCSFCIDAEVPYQPLRFEQMTVDLRFLLTKIKRPRIGWQDPNFGIRFDECLDAIDEAVPPGRIDHIAESSLSLLSEGRLQRLQRTGFKGLLPGIESWFDVGNKSGTISRTGAVKLEQLVDHMNLILRYVPYVQANFIFGLDVDHGNEPFELTKQFLDRCPAVFPAFSLLTAFGEAAPTNLDLQRAGRVRPFPFHFLDNNKSMNVQPANYGWAEFYDRVIDVTEHAFSWPSIGRRLAAQGANLPGAVNLIRGISSEGFGRIKYHREIRAMLETDEHMRRFFEGETDALPEFYRAAVERKLGPLWQYLPEGALAYDPVAYLAKHEASLRPEPASGTVWALKTRVANS